MKKTVTILIILLCLSIGAFGLEITVTAPTVSGGGVPVQLTTDINTAIDGTLSTQATDTLDQYGNMPKLAEGFANAGTYASHAANHRGLMGYKFLVVSAGTMVGIQLPAASEAGLLNALDDLETDGDIYAGLAWQAISAQVGLNCSFLVEDLYLSAKVGKFTIDLEELSFDSFNIGILADYQLIKPKSLLGIIKWRGVKVGSGIILETNTTDYTLALPTLSEVVTTTIATTDYDVTINLDPSINLGVETSTVTIPVDIVTGIRLLWIANISVGVGADLNFGSSEIILGADGITNLDSPGLEGLGAIFTPGTVTVTGGTVGDGPQFLKPRLTASLGLGLGPVKLDVPLTYYFGAEPGLNLGVTLAVTL